MSDWRDRNIEQCLQEISVKNTKKVTKPAARVKKGNGRKAEPPRSTVAAVQLALVPDPKDVPSSQNAVANPEVEVPKVSPRNKLNDLTAREWLPETVSVWTQRGLGANHADAQIERQHPAPFSFSDVRRLVRFFTKSGGTVLDPFVGVGSTLKACALEGRRGIGFELNSRYAGLAEERLRIELDESAPTRGDQKVLVGDSRELIKKMEPDSVDLVVTSPPYGLILHKEDHKVRQERKAHKLDTRYSDDPRDLGNIHNYEQFLESLAEILGGAGRCLKPKKYMAVVLGDFRDKSRYIMLHADVARVLERHKLFVRGLTVLYQRHKRVFPYGYPAAFVPNIHHQFILILQNDK
jgi:DNA modification methylase